MATSIADLLSNYDKAKHDQRTANTIGSNFISMSHFSFIFDPVWSKNPESIPNKISSLLIDSYYHLPRRPDLAFVCLWMAFNSSFHKIAIRDSYITNKNNITDDYGLECAINVISTSWNDVTSIDGSTRTLADLILLAMNSIPGKLTSMIATNALKSICINTYQCGGRYESKAFKGLTSNFPHLAQAIRSCHGKAFSKITHPYINTSDREVNFFSSDPAKSQLIIRSLSSCFQDLFKYGCTSMNHHESDINTTISLNEKERLTLLIRYILYASRNNISHGKVSSRLNSNTANAESYKANVYLYTICYIFLAMMLRDLGYASKSVVDQAARNIQFVMKKPISCY